MNNIESYLNLNVTYRDFYITNNDELDSEECEVQQIYSAVCLDMDIVFSALNISPNKSGYQFWKEAVFLYLMSDNKKISICNDIYPLISQKYSCTKMCIDRAMRRCFENALYHVSKNQNNFICVYLRNCVLYPHNSKLVAKIAELISSRLFQKNKLKIVN